ncbi:MBL fold metallo-hydrolase [Paenibacillus sp. MAH-36]|uniref:MBL fold metallo-hydrolase n=1 Tax=Paenibacillus violae TaxID=3077234 RepID=A0ABU3R9T1_9BACL|nr:MBL fold metallo-hydrolase [Paenibacillus sp. PFR10]MDU0200995.1 MBL fold metallo-hydrolase [Paenibacillus sp. PFR10]
MTICPTVLFDIKESILIDTGMPGSAPGILELIQRAGIRQRLSTILLTHQDIDHIGGLPTFKADIPGLLVYAHEKDQAVINGKQPMVKVQLERLAGLLATLPKKTQSDFKAAFVKPTSANVNRIKVDGETLPFAGGIKMIHTPGHTPGHVCFYHLPSKTLVAGDAMVIENGELKGPVEALTPDLRTALQSLKKFKMYDIENVICYHGGRLRGNIRERIAALTDRI